ncbi:unnamed protein product [Paramecium primaurelia]|uniref:Uncharacterized protein n=1 Tax=Paramecium primaurelia TaxID=5886 RepID=A0A8S1L8B6_PARPR|nr:unnamed protein product [Paramecium primaurelia]
MLQSNQKKIIILPSYRSIILDLSSTTTVFDLFQCIQQWLQFEGSFKQWTCYSVSRQKWLNISEEIGNYQDETIYIKIRHDLESQIQKVETWNLKTIIILPLNHHLNVEVQSTTTLFELFEFIQQHLKQFQTKKIDLKEVLNNGLAILFQGKNG